MGQVSQAKDKLLNSALELVYARSYIGVGVQELCDHAGVKKGSFYHFFPSKRALTLAVLDRITENTKKTIFEAAFTEDLSPLQQLERWIDLIYQDTCATQKRVGHVLGCPIGNLAIELSTQEELIRQKVEAILGQVTTHLEQVLRAAVALGEIPEQDVARTAEAIMAYVEGIHLVAKNQNDPEVIRRLGHEFINRLAGETPTGSEESVAKG